MTIDFYSPNLKLPFFLPQTSMAEYLSNWLIGKLDCLLMMRVLSRSTTSPPTTPSAGDAYLIPGSGAINEWADKDGYLTWYNDQTLINTFAVDEVWSFLEPQEGMRIYDNSDNGYYDFDGTNWNAV